MKSNLGELVATLCAIIFILLLVGVGYKAQEQMFQSYIKDVVKKECLIKGERYE